MAEAIANSNNTYNQDADPNEAAEVYLKGWGTDGNLRKAYDAYLASIDNQHKFWWINSLAVPGVQAAANILLLNRQKEQYDDIEAKRIGYTDAAVNEWSSCVDEILGKLKDATDDVPEPAMYQPVSASGEQYQTVSDNLEIARVSAKPYIDYLNETSREQDLIRQVVLNPDFYKVNEVTWISIGDLIRGNLPESMIVETLTRSKNKAVINGRFGRSSRQSARDLGLTSYRIQKAGREEARRERASQNNDINPLQRHADLREMMITPQQRIGYAMQQGQFIQNSLQNAYNACARKAPHLQAEVQVMLQKCQNKMSLLASKAGMINSNVPDFASVLNSQIKTITEGIGKAAIDGFGNGNSSTPRMSLAQFSQNPPFVPSSSLQDYYSGNYGSKGANY